MVLLETRDVSISFGGVDALSRCSLSVDAGMITGLIGPNGAGKTTMFNVITGLSTPDRGRIVFDGVEITGDSVSRRARRGISRTFQRLEAFNSLSARDNVLVAAETRPTANQRGGPPAERADELLERVGIASVADITVGTLPTGTARLVELARALAAEPRLLLLDEPSSGLNEDETYAMGGLLGELVADGLAVLLVEHDMSFVMGVSTVVHALDFGRIVASGSPAEVQADPGVRTAYLGMGEDPP